MKNTLFRAIGESYFPWFDQAISPDKQKMLHSEIWNNIPEELSLLEQKIVAGYAALQVGATGYNLVRMLFDLNFISADELKPGQRICEELASTTKARFLMHSSTVRGIPVYRIPKTERIGWITAVFSFGEQFALRAYNEQRRAANAESFKARYAK